MHPQQLRNGIHLSEALKKLQYSVALGSIPHQQFIFKFPGQ